MKKRDLGVLFVCALAVLLSFRQESYFTLKIAWIQPVDTSLFKNGHFPTEAEKLPPPIVSDLDGDGKQEIVFVTSDSRIKVVEGERTKSFVSTKQLQELPLKAEATLLPKVGVMTGRQAVGLASGYISTGSNNRTQFVAVLTNGWTVLLFDHNLRLQWESTVKDQVDLRNYYHSEVAITIGTQFVRRQDEGVVIVAARMSPIPKTSFEHDHEAHNDTNQEVKREEVSEDTDPNTHFSYFAFDGRTGALRWKHEAGDFYAESRHVDEHKSLLPEHSYKLHVIGQTKHLGEMDWREWRPQMMQQLPHGWFGREDTKLNLAYFKKQHKDGRSAANPTEWSGEVVGLTAAQLQSLGLSSTSVEKEAATTTKRNVLISHQSAGLEAIHLYSGRPVCTLRLPSEATVADINADGIIDVITLESSSCTAFINSGQPALERLFVIDICATSKKATSWGGRKGAQRPEALEIKPTNPITLPSQDGLLQAARKGERDILFLLSDGRLASYDSTGHLNWATRTQAFWSTTPSSGSAHHSFAASMMFPSLVPFSPYPNTPAGKEDYSLCIGNGMSLVSASGSIMANADIIGGVVISRPTIADFNNDGLNDVILSTPNAYYGYALQSSTGSILFPMLLILLLGVMAVLTVLHHSERFVLKTETDKRSASHKRL